ncbi:MAG: hypothetical protein LBH69_00575, partial [Methanomassiliicoccaceae archaeon]|nr:hypothetical protein [Methanomassiliicoccaceae archaeon]
VEAGTFLEIKAVADKGYSFAWDDPKITGPHLGFIVTGEEHLTGTFSESVVDDGDGNMHSWLLAIVLLLLGTTLFLLLLLNRRRKKEEETGKEQ